MSSPEMIRVLVAGAPRSYQRVLPDGRWLTPEHRAAILSVSPRVALEETTKAELESGYLPRPADVTLLELSPPVQYREEIPTEQFARLVTPRLCWVQSCSSGVGHILGTGLLEKRVLLTNAAGVHAAAIAESTLAAILFHAKRLRTRLQNQERQAWEDVHCDELRDRTVLVIGAGNIGSAIARLAVAFGMHVIGLRRRPARSPFFDEVVGRESLNEALSAADYIAIACPLTAETEGMLGPDQFAAVKRGAYLISVSRGAVVQEPALLDALSDGRLGGAFLDAHVEEPLPAGHPLWTAPGVTVIPHDSHSSPHIGDNIIELFTDNLRRFLAGDPLRNVVDRQRGY